MKSFTKYSRSGFCKFFFSVIVAMGLTISSFVWASHLAAQAPVIKNIQVRPSDKTGISNKDMQNICTAALSALFDHPTTTINVDRIEKGMMHLSYTLPTDNTLRQYKCKLEGQKIIWAKDDGAWQADNSDDQVTFQLTEDEILILVKYSDGSEEQSRFPR